MLIFNPLDPQKPLLNTDLFHFALCEHCGDISIWRNGKLLYPNTSTAPDPHTQMPQAIYDDYMEARNILLYSPRGSAALLRLATEKLAVILVEKAGKEKGKDLNENIGILVKDGLPGRFQQMLDLLRVIGNNAVHPGVLDLKDDAETAQELFELINLIVDNRIAEVEKIESLYNSKISEAQKKHIEDRDNPAQS